MLAVLLAGCASPGGVPVVETPVGPSGEPARAAAGEGWLVVYSAFEVVPMDNSYSTPRTRYEVDDAEGRMLRKVSNFASTFDATPTPVSLSAGSYRVLAAAANYGLVAVPVVIQPNRTTTLYLDGASHQEVAGMGAAAAVRLANGAVIGPRANP
jgi:hypothetical protein